MSTNNPVTRRSALAFAAATPLVACAHDGRTYALTVNPPQQRAVGEGPHIERASVMLREHCLEIGAPSLSAAVGVGGRIVWAEAVGVRDVAAAQPATPATRYRIGSTSKAVTATLTGRLVERGIVDLDAPIEIYMRDLPARWRPLTLRQLHSHTAGIPGYENNRDWFGLWRSWRRQTNYPNVVDALSEFDDAPLIYPPGEGFYYSSFDVVLASAVLQEAAGEPFLDLLRREVFAPADMTASSADHVDGDVPERAQFYQRADVGVRPSRRVNLSDRWASGGLISTPSDLARLGLGYLNHTLLQPDTVATLWTPQRLANGAVNEQSYALGWRSQRRDSDSLGQGVWIVHHGGISTGAMSWLAVYPELGAVIALNTNFEAADFPTFNRIASPLVATILGLSSPASPDD